MKKTILSVCGALAVAALITTISGCAKNADDCCAGGGAACRDKEAAGGKCCGKCPGPTADQPKN